MLSCPRTARGYCPGRRGKGPSFSYSSSSPEFIIGIESGFAWPAAEGRGARIKVELLHITNLPFFMLHHLTEGYLDSRVVCLKCSHSVENDCCSNDLLVVQGGETCR